MRIILASTSPRRRALLTRLGLPFTVVASEVSERSPFPGESPYDYALALAREKATEIARRFPAMYVLGADTVVSIDRQILGKPIDAVDAERMLSLLSGRCHEVVTGVAIAGVSQADGVVTTRVCMRRFSKEEARQYVATGEPMDKAGAYAVQEYGGTLVASVVGCYEAVVGLPLCLIQDLLGQAGLQAAIPVRRLCTHNPDTA